MHVPRAIIAVRCGAAGGEHRIPHVDIGVENVDDGGPGVHPEGGRLVVRARRHPHLDREPRPGMEHRGGKHHAIGIARTGNGVLAVLFPVQQVIAGESERRITAPDALHAKHVVAGVDSARRNRRPSVVHRGRERRGDADRVVGAADGTTNGGAGGPYALDVQAGTVAVDLHQPAVHVVSADHVDTGVADRQRRHRKRCVAVRHIRAPATRRDHRTAADSRPDREHPGLVHVDVGDCCAGAVRCSSGAVRAAVDRPRRPSGIACEPDQFTVDAGEPAPTPARGERVDRA